MQGSQIAFLRKNRKRNDARQVVHLDYRMRICAHRDKEVLALIQPDQPADLDHRPIAFQGRFQ